MTSKAPGRRNIALVPKHWLDLDTQNHTQTNAVRSVRARIFSRIPRVTRNARYLVQTHWCKRDCMTAAGGEKMLDGGMTGADKRGEILRPAWAQQAWFGGKEGVAWEGSECSS